MRKGPSLNDLVTRLVRVERRLSAIEARLKLQLPAFKSKPASALISKTSWPSARWGDMMN